MNTISRVSAETPVQNRKTLADYSEDGLLAPIDVNEFRARFAGFAVDGEVNVRAAAIALVSRVLDYWARIDYCSGTVKTARSSKETARAIAAPQFASRYGLRTGPAVNDPLEGPAAVWTNAIAFCPNTAFQVAQWEYSTAVPDVARALAVARVAALSACKDEHLTGVNWLRTARRMSTFGARRHLGKVLAAVPHAWLVIHPESQAPSFFGAAHYAQIAPKLEHLARERNVPFKVWAPVALTAREAA